MATEPDFRTLKPMRFHPTIALTMVLTTFAAMPATPQARARTIVALLAHADDESAASPVLARYAREGVQVYLVIAADGSAGSGTGAYLTRPDSGPRDAELATVRAEEARCAAAAIGAQAPILLGFPDGKLGDYLSNRAQIYQLTERIAKEIERLRPDVVITWGPDGGTGHPDHRIVSNVATQLLRAGAPGMPQRLFYMYLPAESFRLANPQRGAPPLLVPEAKYFTVRVPFTPADLEASLTSMACHRTQLAPEMLQRMQQAIGGVLNGVVAFIPVMPSLQGNDLFR
jgi:LmbE family N-acetylglucosaminyl deacetylase